nr:zinc finger, CCHC-type [Tanacetum cinerariifolium]
MTLEEAIGRLKTYEERIKYKKGKQVDHQERLMFTRHDNRGKHFRGRGRRKHRFSHDKNHENFKERENSHKSYNENNFKKPNHDNRKIRCYKCKKIRHIAPKCPQRTNPNEQSNLIEEDLEPTLLMATLKEEEYDKVLLHQEDVGYKETNMDSLWYLDNGASNHMTGIREHFKELDEKVGGKDVMFKEDETWDWKDYISEHTDDEHEWSYEAFHGLSLVVQLISAVRIIAFDAWGLGPLLRASRILFLQQLTRKLEDQENVTDPVARLRMQSSALRSDALLQNLEASGREQSTTTDPATASDGGVLNDEAGVRNLSQPKAILMYRPPEAPEIPEIPSGLDQLLRYLFLAVNSQEAATVSDQETLMSNLLHQIMSVVSQHISGGADGSLSVEENQNGGASSSRPDGPSSPPSPKQRKAATTVGFNLELVFKYIKYLNKIKGKRSWDESVIDRETEKTEEPKKDRAAPRPGDKDRIEGSPKKD